MEKIRLKPISVQDVDWLNKTEYKNLSKFQRQKLVEDCIKEEFNGEFFKFFLIEFGGEIIGVLNVKGHGDGVVSVAPEILAEYRNKGFASKSLILAYQYVKEKGFTKLTAGIREDNKASQSLHLKLGFKYEKDCTSKNGNLLKIYSKNL